MFQNRHHAGIVLASMLSKYMGENIVVLAIPRGGVVIGYEIAKALEAPLDVIVVRKIGHPDYPEYAIGAVGKDGETIINDEERERIDPDVLFALCEEQRKEAARRTAKFKIKEPIAIHGRTVVLTDDGAATGLTLQLAIKMIKRMRPKRIVVAIPVIAADTAAEIQKKVDDLVVAEEPELFTGAVASHYHEFNEVRDDAVTDLLLRTL